MTAGTGNMRKHLQIGTGKNLFSWSESVSEYTKEKVCDRERKTDVFSKKGRVNEERMPTVPSCSSPHTHFSPIPSMWELSAWVTLSYLGDKIGSLSSKMCLSPIFSLPCVRLGCVYIDPSRVSCWTTYLSTWLQQKDNGQHENAKLKY